MARIEKDPKFFERKAGPDDFVEAIASYADPQKREPLAHGFEINSCKFPDVILRGSGEIGRRGSRPARAATVGAPVADIHADEVPAANRGARGTGQSAVAVFRRGERHVTAQRLSVVTRQLRGLVVTHPIAQTKNDA